MHINIFGSETVPYRYIFDKSRVTCRTVRLWADLLVKLLLLLRCLPCVKGDSAFLTVLKTDATCLRINADFQTVVNPPQTRLCVWGSPIAPPSCRRSFLSPWISKSSCSPCHRQLGTLYPYVECSCFAAAAESTMATNTRAAVFYVSPSSVYQRA